MSNKRQPCLLALLFSMAASGCAGDPATPAAPQSRHVGMARYFPKPAPLNGEPPRVIRLEIQVVSGALNFVSLDRPSYDIRLTPSGVTAERDDVILEADELHWHVGETVITLKGGQVTLDYKRPDGTRSQLLFELSGKYVKVSRDGKWVKSETSALVDLAAETGQMIMF